MLCMKRILLIFLLLAGCSFSRGIEMTDLKGKQIQDIKKTYGNPVIIRHEQEKQMWAYKQGECSVLIFFDGQGIVQFAESRGKCLL